MRLGHRGNMVREKKASPKPEGYEDVNDKAFIVAVRNGKPATWHNGYWYIQQETPKDISWAKRMNP